MAMSRSHRSSRIGGKACWARLWKHFTFHTIFSFQGGSKIPFWLVNPFVNKGGMPLGWAGTPCQTNKCWTTLWYCLNGRKFMVPSKKLLWKDRFPGWMMAINCYYRHCWRKWFSMWCFNLFYMWLNWFNQFITLSPPHNIINMVF